MISNEDDMGRPTVFLKKTQSMHEGRNISFLKEGDEGSSPKFDIVRKLPTPLTIGGTAQRGNHYIFQCDLDQWDLS